MRRRIHPLAAARIAASGLFAALFALAFLGPAAATGGLFGLVAGTQLFPAAARLLAGGALASAACALALAASTLLFGRLYCSLLCPLGAAQDAAFALGRRLREYRLGYARGPGLLRAASFAAAALALALGAAPAASFLDPYSLSGRFLEYALRPAAEALAGLLSPAA
ncbi:MAG TPA: 4Fe-4S binding protein, partial [Spirochaetales bacterium]|nr:4Fe-4S binding protein [Spirochaetales bacterium]